jgi:AraC-like DNA-binding protein
MLLSSPLLASPIPMLQVTRFGEHDELASLIQGGDAEFIQRTSGAFRGQFTIVALDGGSIQFGEVDLPYLARGTAERLIFSLHLRPLRDYVWKGRKLLPESIIVLPPHSEHQDITPGQSYWALLSFEPALLERTLNTLIGTDSPVHSLTSLVLLPQLSMFETLRRRLVDVHAAVTDDPSLLDVTEARHGIQESILSALALAIGSASRVRPPGYGAAARTRVARLVEAYLSSSSSESLYLADLCAVAGVGERTLRYIFQERYGMSPVRYLKLRRLHQMRRALRRADPDCTTVRSIANRCGIWHLGRFASEYKVLFSEAPLETLRKTCPLSGQGMVVPPRLESVPHPLRVPGLH